MKIPSLVAILVMVCMVEVYGFTPVSGSMVWKAIRFLVVSRGMVIREYIRPDTMEEYSTFRGALVTPTSLNLARNWS